MSALPEQFVRSLSEILPSGEIPRLVAALDTEPAVAVRFNPFKLAAPPEGEAVPWCRYGFHLEGRPNFTLDPLHHAGVYYVQEPSSMFIEHIVRRLFPDPEGLSILDMCAAPGGKTTLLSVLAGLEGLVVANETVSQRASVLAGNARRWGLGNIAVTANDPAHFSLVRDFFDLVLVDAPCSGEGMFRKTAEARAQWSPHNVEMCAGRQRKIVSDAWRTLKPGGILIYSTCTFNRQENEENALWIAGNFDCDPVSVDCPADWGVEISETPGPDAGQIYTYRFFPHRLKGEGFTATVFRKADAKAHASVKQLKKPPFRDVAGGDLKEVRSYVGQPGFMKFSSIGEDIYGHYMAALDDTVRLSGALNVIWSGVRMGRIMKGRLRPDHPLALFHDVGTGTVPCAELDMEAALDYLRKKDIPPAGLTEGYNLLTFNGYPLGWAKRIGNRVNNLLPKEVRIMNL